MSAPVKERSIVRRLNNSPSASRESLERKKAELLDLIEWVQLEICVVEDSEQLKVLREISRFCKSRAKSIRAQIKAEARLA